MSSDGTNSYKWDAENRLVQITYPSVGNTTQYVYDGLSWNRKISETVSGSLVSTKQFVVYGGEKYEERDAAGAVVKRYFDLGVKDSAGSHFYTTDNTSSIREVCNSSSVIEAQYSYDPSGRTVQLQGTFVSDFQYTGFYTHQRSQLNLADYRQYNSSLSRWMNRDPMGEIGGINLYAYASNDPISRIDPVGMRDGSQTETQTQTGTDGSGGNDVLYVVAYIVIAGIVILMITKKNASESDYEKSNGHRGSWWTGQQAEESFYRPCRQWEKSPAQCRRCCCMALNDMLKQCEDEYGPNGTDCITQYQCCVDWAWCYWNMCNARCKNPALWKKETECPGACD